MCSQDQELFENTHKISPLPQYCVESSGEKESRCIQVNMVFDVSSDFLTNRFSQTAESPGPRVPTHLVLSGEPKF